MRSAAVCKELRVARMADATGRAFFGRWSMAGARRGEKRRDEDASARRLWMAEMLGGELGLEVAKPSLRVEIKTPFVLREHSSGTLLGKRDQAGQIGGPDPDISGSDDTVTRYRPSRVYKDMAASGAEARVQNGIRRTRKCRHPAASTGVPELQDAPFVHDREEPPAIRAEADLPDRRDVPLQLVKQLPLAIPDASGVLVRSRDSSTISAETGVVSQMPATAGEVERP